MKTLIVLLTLISINVNSSEAFKYSRPKDPRTGIFYSHNSSGIGVCRLLGFSKYINLSIIKGYRKNTTFKIDDVGNIIDGKRGYNITSITCSNPVASYPKSKVFLLKSKIIHPNSFLPYSTKSSMFGICRSLGYARYITNSSRSKRFFNMSIEVNERGEVVNGIGNSTVTQIVCSNYVGVYPKNKTYLINAPVNTKTQLYFSSDSDLRGICRSKGFINTIKNGVINGHFLFDEVAKVDKRGIVTQIESNNWVSQILCVDKERI